MIREVDDLIERWLHQIVLSFFYLNGDCIIKVAEYIYY